MKNGKSNKYIVQIFDIEEEKTYEQKINLRIIKSLSGFSQITINNILYLCGSDNYNSISAFLFKIDPSYSNATLSLLVNSIHPHYNPSLVCYKGETIIAVGGKQQKKCDWYNISLKKWRSLPSLPEDRYKATLLINDDTNYLYLFGGFCFKDNTNHKSIFKLYLEESSATWETIIVIENENYLSRNSSVAFQFDEDIYICGGCNNLGKDTEFIVEYNTVKDTVKKFELSLKKSASFDDQSGVNLNKLHYAFFDKSSDVHTVSKNEFKMSVFKFNDYFNN